MFWVLFVVTCDAGKGEEVKILQYLAQETDKKVKWKVRKLVDDT